MVGLWPWRGLHWASDHIPRGWLRVWRMSLEERCTWEWNSVESLVVYKEIYFRLFNFLPLSLSLSHTLIILYLSLFRSFFTSPMVSVCFILSTYIWSPSSDFILSVVRWPGVGGRKSLLTSNWLLISCSTGVSTSVTLLEVPWNKINNPKVNWSAKE